MYGLRVWVLFFENVSDRYLPESSTMSSSLIGPDLLSVDSSYRAALMLPSVISFENCRALFAMLLKFIEGLRPFSGP